MPRERFNDLLDTIYAAAGDPARWPEVLRRVSDHLGAVDGQLVYFSPSRQTGFNVWGRTSTEFDEIFWQHYARNLWTIAMERLPADTPAASNKIIERKVFMNTGFYTDCLKPLGIEGILSASLSIKAMERGIGGFSFGISERALEKTEESLRQFTRVLPHLTRSLETTIQIGRYADGTRQLARALELMPSAALLISATRRITYANPAAETLLRLNDGLCASPGGDLHLTAALPTETAVLDQTLAGALLIANGDDGSTLHAPLRLTRPSGRAPLLVLPVPLPPPAFAMWELAESARALVLVIDPEAGALGAADVLETSFALTAAEARVAALIGGGLNGPQTAAALNISPETVKTHLARCFEKTGIHSQSGLARLIGMLPHSNGY